MQIALTGITGFVGRQVAHQLLQTGHSVRAFVRTMPSEPIAGIEYLVTGDYTQVQDWALHLNGVDAVVHLAALAHQIKGNAAEVDYIRVNVDVTRALAQGAKLANVSKFIFLSSVKVLGEETPIDAPFTHASVPNPQDAYGRSKLMAEQIVMASGLNYVIFRVPLIYGAGMKGNLRTLQKLIQMRVPLPLASIHNQRSIVDVERVADAIVPLEFDHNIWLLSNPQDVSTADLIRRIAADINMKPLLFPFPPALIKLACTLLGKQGVYQRLCGSLRVKGL